MPYVPVKNRLVADPPTDGGCADKILLRFPLPPSIVLLYFPELFPESPFHWGCCALAASHFPMTCFSEVRLALSSSRRRCRSPAKRQTASAQQRFLLRREDLVGRMAPSGITLGIAGNFAVLGLV